MADTVEALKDFPASVSSGTAVTGKIDYKAAADTSISISVTPNTVSVQPTSKAVSAGNKTVDVTVTLTATRTPVDAQVTFALDNEKTWLPQVT